MKLRAGFRRRKENFAEMKIFCSKCLAKDIKLSSFLGGNLSNFFLIFIVILILLNVVCLKY